MWLDTRSTRLGSRPWALAVHVRVRRMRPSKAGRGTGESSWCATARVRNYPPRRRWRRSPRCRRRAWRQLKNDTIGVRRTWRRPKRTSCFIESVAHLRWRSRRRSLDGVTTGRVCNSDRLHRRSRRMVSAHAMHTHTGRCRRRAEKDIGDGGSVRVEAGNWSSVDLREVRRAARDVAADEIGIAAFQIRG